jgi:hypothetical protein
MSSCDKVIFGRTTRNDILERQINSGYTQRNKKVWPLGASIDHKKKNRGAEALGYQNKNQFQTHN